MLSNLKYTTKMPPPLPPDITVQIVVSTCHLSQILTDGGSGGIVIYCNVQLALNDTEIPGWAGGHGGSYFHQNCRCLDLKS